MKKRTIFFWSVLICVALYLFISDSDLWKLLFLALEDTIKCALVWFKFFHRLVQPLRAVAQPVIEIIIEWGYEQDGEFWLVATFVAVAALLLLIVKKFLSRNAYFKKCGEGLFSCFKKISSSYSNCKRAVGFVGQLFFAHFLLFIVPVLLFHIAIPEENAIRFELPATKIVNHFPIHI